MTARASVRLVDIEPEITRFLDEKDRAAVHSLALPVRNVGRGTEEVAPKLQQVGAFAAIVLDGMLLQTLQLGDRTAVRLLGPGDIVSAPCDPDLATLDESTVQAAAPTRLALLGNEILAASRRWPLLMAGLHDGFARQAERLAAQLVICQISRVEDRLLALMWLLADSWGRVTMSGTVLPLSLTHGTLGALVGARRPTVTLALGELSGRGAIVSQDHGWLLVEGPSNEAKSTTDVRMPRLVMDGAAATSNGAASTSNGAAATSNGAAATGGGARQAPRHDLDQLTTQLSSTRAELHATVAELHHRHQENVARFRSRLGMMRSSREQWQRARDEMRRLRTQL